MKKKKIDFRYDTETYLMNNGSIVDKLRLINSNYDIPQEEQETILQKIKELLNPDGGIPFGLNPSNPSSVKETAEIVPLILPFKDQNEELIRKMLTFLISRQKSDGGFAETMNLAPLIEDRYGTNTGQDWYPVGKSITWLTGKALFALSEAASDDEHRLRKARDFLLYSQNEDGHWPDFKGRNESDPLGTGNILPALRAIGVNSGHKVYKDARAALFQHLMKSAQSKSISDMVDLYAVDKIETDLERKVVSDALELIAESQNPDGGWAEMGSKKSSPELTSLLTFALGTCLEEHQ